MNPFTVAVMQDEREEILPIKMSNMI